MAATASGTYANGPGGGVPSYAGFYFCTDIGALYFCDGVAWYNTSARGLLVASVLGSATASTTLTVPTSAYLAYNNLELVGTVRCSDTAESEFLEVKFNSDTGANYDQQYLSAVNTTVAGAGAVAQSAILIGLVTAASAGANKAGIVRLTIPYAFGTAFQKNVVSESGYADQSAATTGTFRTVGTWRNTAAVTSLTITDQGGGNLNAGSFFELYGVL
jgi:hypothetical protein